MRRVVLTAALLLALTALPVWAQRGGFRMAPRVGGLGRGPRGGGFVRVQPRFGFHGGQGFRGGFAFGGNPRVRVVFNRRPFFPHRRFFRPRFFGGGFFPFVSYPYYPLGLYDSFSYAQQPPYTSDTDAGLASEVYRLQAEVDQLREQQRIEREQYASAAPPMREPQPAPAPRAAPETPAPITVLVYRDGHKVEVKNYAMVGETLWILSEQRAQKVPFAELNLDATRRANEERGVEFTVPSKPAR